MPRHSQPSSVPTPPETVHLMEHLASTPVSASQIRTHTNRDPLLSKVKQQDWLGGDVKPYKRCKNELIPQLCDLVVDKLHESHPGIESLWLSVCMVPVSRNICVRTIYSIRLLP